MKSAETSGVTGSSSLGTANGLARSWCVCALSFVRVEVRRAQRECNCSSPQRSCLAAAVVNSSSSYFVLGTLLIIINELIALWVNKHLFIDSTAKTCCTRCGTFV